MSHEEDHYFQCEESGHIAHDIAQMFGASNVMNMDI